MEKQKRWQGYVILAVILLTLYNILPTVFYYAQPLREPIDSKRSESIALAASNRVNELEYDSKSWLEAFCKLLGIKASSIELDKQDPRLINISFANEKDATLFQRFLPKAGALIPFVPAQLELLSAQENSSPHSFTVMRQVGVHIDPAEINDLFKFTEKYSADGQITPFYKELVFDRVKTLALALGGPSQNAVQIASSVAHAEDPSFDDVIVAISRDINEFSKITALDSPLAKRFYPSLFQGMGANADQLAQQFVARAEAAKTRLTNQKNELIASQKSHGKESVQSDSSQEQALSSLDSQLTALDKATLFIRQNIALFKSDLQPFTPAKINSSLEASSKSLKANETLQEVTFQGYNPFVEALRIDWNNDLITLKLYDDVQALRQNAVSSEAETYTQEKVNSLIFNEIARASRLSDETLKPSNDSFAVYLNALSDAKSFLALDLGQVASKQAKYLVEQLHWNSTHPDLNSKAYPIHLYEQWKQLPLQEQKLGLVVYIPALHGEEAPSGFRPGSLYVIARGMEALLQKGRLAPDASETKLLMQDFQKLAKNLQQYGFIGYPGASFGIDPSYSKDYIFEWSDYYNNLLNATREAFSVHGTKRWAVLDFSDVEQRILVENRIVDQQQESLLKWKEDYTAAQVSLDATNKYLVPPPTQNPFWNNLKISFYKFFHGDDRKILKWGLDLSGGKTVRIGLRDHNNRPVTNPADLRQAENELYTRINKMGVSERTIRIENNNLVLEFPGAQGMSAQDLVKASSMTFHIVNEKFSKENATLKDAINQFLQEVWNEAVVTNRQNIESINEIAFEHLGGSTSNLEQKRPRSTSAQLLYDNGLRLANFRQDSADSSYNDSLSTIGKLRGEDFSEWDNQTHPLIVLFYNYALEGSSLTNVQVGYDPSKGNVLTFGIKRSFDSREGSPRDDFYAWTSQYAEDKIQGTPKEIYSRGRGWRMAVVLNGTVISSPTLNAALHDGATISGHFSQREINQLAADLKAGSLSFTPQILSEQNVSPELGKEERTHGIAASFTALIVVVAAMIAYYRFAGIVAASAVLFNILIMWAVLQNIDAALTLPGIAGIVLTIGMAVDANVLVFERFREEFKNSGRLGSALQIGYRKAFSAIIDSNITTIIAALILIQFDSGPIKAFAVMLIIGIISSMFTALFMTRYFFAGWLQKGKNKTLHMAQFFEQTNFDFLAQTKKALVLTFACLLIGGYFFVSQYKEMFGMDFTGGYSLTVQMEEKPEQSSYRLAAIDALLSHGATSNDIQVRELSRPNLLRIQLARGMEEMGHPFYGMPEVLNEGNFTFSYQSNPRMAWVVNALEGSGLKIVPSDLAALDSHWTAVSGQFSDAMRNNALIGLLVALISILIYITMRFEFNFALAAVIALAHDVLLTLGVLAICYKLGMSVHIDMQTIGAIMTIIGYSLNDTIIVFDRIREDRNILRKLSFRQVINHAINVTLSRTVMTSGTTLLVLLALLLLGGSTIFSFALVMTIGVFIGTLSSLFIAGPVLLYLQDREAQKVSLPRTRSL